MLNNLLEGMNYYKDYPLITFEVVDKEDTIIALFYMDMLFKCWGCDYFLAPFNNSSCKRWMCTPHNWPLILRFCQKLLRSFAMRSKMLLLLSLENFSSIFFIYTLKKDRTYIQFTHRLNKVLLRTYLPILIIGKAPFFFPKELEWEMDLLIEKTIVMGSLPQCFGYL